MQSGHVLDGEELLRLVGGPAGEHVLCSGMLSVSACMYEHVYKQHDAYLLNLLEMTSFLLFHALSLRLKTNGSSLSGTAKKC